MSTSHPAVTSSGRSLRLYFAFVFCAAIAKSVEVVPGVWVTSLSISNTGVFLSRRFFRLSSRRIPPTMAALPAKPPTTAPAITPEFELDDDCFFSFDEDSGTGRSEVFDGSGCAIVAVPSIAEAIAEAENSEEIVGVEDSMSEEEASRAGKMANGQLGYCHDPVSYSSESRCSWNRKIIPVTLSTSLSGASTVQFHSPPPRTSPNSINQRVSCSGHASEAKTFTYRVTFFRSHYS